MIRLAINGARGRMGARLCACAEGDGRFQIVGACTRDEPVTELARDVDLLIDVSSDAGARASIKHAIRTRTPVLIATTALSADTLDAATAASAHIPVMIAPNTSVGIAVVKHLAATAARLLGETFDASIVEFHHAHKADSPSGTARAIAEAIEAESGAKIFSKNLCGIRVKEVVGEHSIRFSGAAETIEITHRAATRDLFVLGALRAGAWLIDQPPGLYRIEQALNLEP